MAVCYTRNQAMDDAREYFTVEEANAELAVLREIFGRVLQLRTQLKALFSRLDEADAAPTHAELASGEPWDDDDDYPDEVRRDRAVFQALVDTLREQVEAIQATGCVIKDIETGLVDWYALHEGREVFLCWQYGEREVTHWHELESGYSGRRPISELSLPSRPAVR